MKTVYVIGHRNPDSDSIISATAYARLKQLMGHSEYVAARAGNLSPQTEYIMNRFKLPIPQYVPDLIPKVSYYMTRECQTVSCDTSLWKAVNAMQEHDRKVMPVVQDGGKYVSLLHYSAFAKNVLQIVNPEKSAAISTTIGLISETISAQPVITFNEEETFRCVTLVAGSQFESFKKRLALHDPSTVIVITGDRKDIQEYCAQEKVRAIIITSGYTPDKELRALAEKNGVSLLVSPYDTSATSCFTALTHADFCAICSLNSCVFMVVVCGQVYHLCAVNQVSTMSVDTDAPPLVQFCAVLLGGGATGRRTLEVGAPLLKLNVRNMCCQAVGASGPSPYLLASPVGWQQ